MSYITQLNPSIPVETPKGRGEAIMVIDYGPEYHLIMVVILDINGQFWSFNSTLLRGCKNETLGRGEPA